MSYEPGMSGIYGGWTPSYNEEMLKRTSPKEIVDTLTELWYYANSRGLTKAQKAQRLSEFDNAVKTFSITNPKAVKMFYHMRSSAYASRNTDDDRAENRKLANARWDTLAKSEKMPSFYEFYTGDEDMEDFDASYESFNPRFMRKYNYPPEIDAMPKGKARNKAMAEFRKQYKKNEELKALGLSNEEIARQQAQFPISETRHVSYNVNRDIPILFNKEAKKGDAYKAYQRLSKENKKLRRDILRLTGKGFEGSGFY